MSRHLGKQLILVVKLKYLEVGNVLKFLMVIASLDICIIVNSYTITAKMGTIVLSGRSETSYDIIFIITPK